MKVTLLAILLFAIICVSAGPDRYLRPGPKNPTVCNKGDFLRNGRCWRPCPKGFSVQYNNWSRCQKNCNANERSVKGRCMTRRCINGWAASGSKCWLKNCPRGWVSKSVTQCWRPCPKPYKAVGIKCVNSGARPGQCDSYTRPITNRASRPFIIYTQQTRPRTSYYPRCPTNWNMFPGRKCYGPCKKNYLKKGRWCKNKICFPKIPTYTRGGPKNPHVCPKGYTLRNVRCWKNCPAGYVRRWNNWFQCQAQCKGGETHSKGVCYTKRCVNGYRSVGGRCYAIACPRGWVSKSYTQCWRPCPKPYKAKGAKCVNFGAKPGQCDSYTRPVTTRSNRPFITYRPRIIGRANRYPGCPGGWRMEKGKCRKLCRSGYTIVGGYCHLTKCIGI